jgi:hypothetical protein
MKQIYILTSFLFLGFINTEAQTTFDWDTAPIDNGNNITETINGITTTFIGTSTTSIMNIGNFGGSSGSIVASTDVSATERTTSATFNFSESLYITSILAFEGDGSSIDYTFTPLEAINPTVVASLVNGFAQVNLNWTGVTSFTVTSTDAYYGFDNLIVNNITLSKNDFTLKAIKVFPNPSSNFIKINGLTTIENYEIYNTIGQKIKRGIILKNKKIDIQNLTSGIYFMKLANGKTIKFIKK